MHICPTDQAAGSETPSLVVTTAADVVDDSDGQTSLREAIAYAATLGGPQTITFSNNTDHGAANFYDGSGHKIALADGPISLGSDLTITGPGASALTVSGENAGRVLTILGNCTVTLDALTITKGQANASGQGGGIYNAGTLNLSNSTVSGNSIAIDPSLSSASGGGIYNSGTLSVSNSTITGNWITAGNSTFLYGGGISNAGTLTFANSTISGNSLNNGAQGDIEGGGLFNSGTANLANSTISGNTLTGGNLATNRGGGISTSGTADLVNSTISDNSLCDSNGINMGGGIYNTQSLTVRNVTIAGNSSGRAAISRGGGICNLSSAGGVADTILATNTASDGPDEQGFVVSAGHNLIGNGDGSGFSNGVNADQVGTGAAPIDPLLGPIGSYGGATQTRPLLPGSPAIDGGGNLTTLVGDLRDLTTNTFYVSGGLYTPDGIPCVIQIDAEQMIVISHDSASTITVSRGASGTAATTHKNGAAINLARDQRGLPRIVSDSGAAVDIGAYETSSFTVAVGAGNNQSTYATYGFADPLVVRVTATDIGEPVAGVRVIFTAPSSGATGTFAGGGTSVPLTTGADGTVSAPVTANGTAGAYTVSATVAGVVSPADFSLTNLQQRRVLSLADIETGNNAGPTVDWRLTFEEAESGLTASNFALDGTSFGAVIGTPITSDGGLTWIIPVTTGTNGTLGLTVINDTGLAPTLTSELPFAGDTLTISKPPTTTKLVAAGEPAPGAGTNGLPADATITTFGTPAIDQDGDVACLAKWSSGNGKIKGSGLFTGSACLAIIGGDVFSPAAGPTGETFRSFADPVIDHGEIACLATLAKGNTSIAAVLRFDLSGALTLVARAGEDALCQGTMFKRFQAVALAGDYLAFLAQVTGGTHSATATDNVGLWIKSSTGPLQLALRENQVLPNGKRLKSLSSFKAGNDSPGCGRGWLIQQSAATGGAVTALCRCTDNSQAIVQVDGSDVIHPTVLAQAGEPFTRGGLSTPTATFASLGLPAINGSGICTFLGTLAPNAAADVTTSNARGVYLGTSTSGYDLIAGLAGGPAGETGAKFSVLKDPVLSANGAIAFPATIKGGPGKGLAGSTLWWVPAGGSLTLLAQSGGMQPPEVPAGAQWNAFTSLAIAAHRGPIFAATLVPKKGGVIDANASGVWGSDSGGMLRLLFRTGDSVQFGGGLVKTVKAFALLKATTGSLGVTRSFNDAGQVAWLATFTDRTQALLITEVP